MMPVEQQGMNLDPDVLIRVQSNFISQARIKEVQMEAAIAQLSQENAQLRAQLEREPEMDTQAEFIEAVEE